MSTRTLNIIASLVALALVSGGAIGIYEAIRYRTPPATTLAATPAASLPTFVTLKDIEFDVEHLLKLHIGSEVLFIPVRAKGAPAKSEYPVLIQTSAKELLAAVGSKSPEIQVHLAALAKRTEVTGRTVRSDDRLINSAREQVPSISKEAVLIDEGATPHPAGATIELLIGLGLFAIVLAGGFEKAPPVSPQAPTA